MDFLPLEQKLNGVEHLVAGSAVERCVAIVVREAGVDALHCKQGLGGEPFP